MTGEDRRPIDLTARSRWIGAVVALGTLLFFTLLIAGCVPDLQHPPRLATETAQIPLSSSAAGEPLLQVPAPTATGAPVTDAAATVVAPPTRPTVTLWINKTSPQYEETVLQMIDRFTASHDIHVELLTIAPDMLPDLVRTAATTSTIALPDVVVLPLEYAVGWAERGILDAAAASAVVDDLGPETFVPEALDLVAYDDRVSAIPSDGWQQLLIYRKDWFEQQNLEPPTSFERMLTAADVISDRVNLIYSFNMPTESSLRATSRAFEQMAIANGCQLVDERGELQILEPACRQALEFYRFLCNSYCPPGVQTEVSALNAYLEGRAGMIIAPPSVLPILAGLDDDYRASCPACTSSDYLAQNSGIVTALQGYDPSIPPQNLGEIAYLGITANADTEAASALARFWFTDGYLDWLSVEPERKVPMRQGTAEDPTRFIDAWYELPLAPGAPSLSDIYGADVAADLASGVVNPQRWGYLQGEGGLVTTIYENLTLSILLQELLSGYYDSDRAAIEGYKRLVDLIPNYAYYVDPEPEP